MSHHTGFIRSEIYSLDWEKNSDETGVLCQHIECLDESENFDQNFEQYVTDFLAQKECQHIDRPCADPMVSAMMLDACTSVAVYQPGCSKWLYGKLIK
ncbi:hypothetical protein WN943_001797 [Citrus x changshan-huyou]